jgi:GTP cyclohydrolase II
VVETLPIICSPNPYNLRYLETKQKKLGHLLKIPDNSKDKD